MNMIILIVGSWNAAGKFKCDKMFGVYILTLTISQYGIFPNPIHYHMGMQSFVPTPFLAFISGQFRPPSKDPIIVNPYT